MQIRKLKDCQLITAGDNSNLRELLHPDREYEFSGRYSLAHAVVSPGEKSLKHVLKSSEVYYILSGRGTMHIDSDSTEVEAGDCFEIPPESVQWIENNSKEDLIFFCIVDPAWQAVDEEILNT